MSPREYELPNPSGGTKPQPVWALSEAKSKFRSDNLLKKKIQHEWEYLDAFSEEITPSKFKDVLRSVFKAAMEGNIQAAKLIIDKVLPDQLIATIRAERSGRDGAGIIEYSKELAFMLDRAMDEHRERVVLQGELDRAVGEHRELARVQGTDPHRQPHPVPRGGEVPLDPREPQVPPQEARPAEAL